MGWSRVAVWMTIGRLLRQEGYRLQRTRKTLESAQRPDRDAQFAYLNEQARAHLAAGWLVVSDHQLAAVPLWRHDWHGDWNYTVAPAHQRHT